ncbi:Hypothetical_protein [Hexamita inflata]|uniref:Hypothetical_protein n=1 Tax=Hexamita inflata TaxID=28002 RepID=A0ABP1GZT3_9EUKA
MINTDYICSTELKENCAIGTAHVLLENLKSTWYPYVFVVLFQIGIMIAGMFKAIPFRISRNCNFMKRFRSNFDNLSPHFLYEMIQVFIPYQYMLWLVIELIFIGIYKGQYEIFLVKISMHLTIFTIETLWLKKLVKINGSISKLKYGLITYFNVALEAFYLLFNQIFTFKIVNSYLLKEKDAQSSIYLVFNIQISFELFLSLLVIRIISALEKRRSGDDMFDVSGRDMQEITYDVSQFKVSIQEENTINFLCDEQQLI